MQTEKRGGHTYHTLKEDVLGPWAVAQGWNTSQACVQSPETHLSPSLAKEIILGSTTIKGIFQQLYLATKFILCIYSLYEIVGL